MKFDDARHKVALESIRLAAQALTPQVEYFGLLVDAERRMHSSLPVTDPTLYRTAVESDGLRQQIELAKAAIAFVLAVQKVKGEIQADPS